MKRLFLMLPVLLLTGCGLVTGPANTITTQHLDGRVVVEEMSDDAVYYQQAARYAEARGKAVDCPGCTAEQRVIVALAAALTDKGYVPRGMNGYELAAKVSSDVVSVAPYGVLGWAFYRVSKMDTGPKITGETVAISESFNPQEVHSTGSDYSPVSAPWRPETTTTTYAPQ